MDFQCASADAVVRAMFDKRRPQKRFLVADEVGLGKTKVARAVVAETITRLWDEKGVNRIDIIYICSNAQIARQNLRDLDVLNAGRGQRLADRITMLPLILGGLQQHRVNLVSFTPATSLTMGNSTGRAGERAMLHRLLREVWGDQLLARKGAHRLLSNEVKNWEYHLGQLAKLKISREVTAAFRATLTKHHLKDPFVELSHGNKYLRGRPAGANALIGQLRAALAEACIKLLSPDLVILDEFQRFPALLESDNEDAYLAQMLFDQTTARVLLLSATPYRALSRSSESDDHFEDFKRTTSFLLGESRKQDLATLTENLGDLRRGVLNGRPPQELAGFRDTAQQILRTVMVRTERLASTEDRNGMLRMAENAECSVTAADVQSFIGTDLVARHLGLPPVADYWKSAPYLLNFMDEYKLKQELHKRAKESPAVLSGLLTGRHMLDLESIDKYRSIDPRNGRLRWLFDDLTDHFAWDLAWMPPALPQTTLGGSYAKPMAREFTKRLIFSGWTVVPKAVAALTSYELERRHHLTNKGYSSRVARDPIPFRVERQHATNYAGLALLWPSAQLDRIGDPLAFAQRSGTTLPVPVDQLHRAARQQIQKILRGALASAPTTGRTDLRWYVYAQILLDKEFTSVSGDWHGSSGGTWTGEGVPHEGLQTHLDLIREMEEAPSLGRPPEDLIGTLASLAVAGPATSSLRALRRQRDRFGWCVSNDQLLAGAARLAWGIRSMLSTPEIQALITHGNRAKTTFWKQALEHCKDGGLSSVLDEWLHLLPDQERVALATAEDPVSRVVDAAVSALTLPSSPLKTEHPEVVDNLVTFRSETMRPHFAVRFGQARGVTAEGDNPQRVRQAFNSPFWPFLLVSTSVGQEGLDFHYYSHAVVHWNLPGNPVDLEQREGRVHRYKNHAVRKNVASRMGDQVEITGADDPWDMAFALAKSHRDLSASDIVPCWVYPLVGGAAIERHVPMLPLSREIGCLEDLRRATALYRMAFGQPRQADLVATLSELSSTEVQEMRSAIAINLAP
jgi:hypothetical protein